MPDAETCGRTVIAAFLGETPDYFRRGQTIEPELSGMNFTDALEQKFSRSLLGNDSAATLPHSLHKIFPCLAGHEHDHPRRQFGLLYGAVYLLAVGGTGGPTQQNNVRAHSSNLFHRALG